MTKDTEIVLPSGAVLKITPAPFADAKNLYQAILREFRELKIDMAGDLESKAVVASLYKEIFCVGFSSKEIEAALWPCLKRCTYNRGGILLKIDEDTFEPIECREDYFSVCLEVAQATIAPFMKSLYAQFSVFMDQAQKGQK